MSLDGSGSAESDPVIPRWLWLSGKRSQIARLQTPRERATETGREPHCTVMYTRPPLRAPQPRTRQTTRGQPGRACKCALCIWYIFI